jgi:hypothetical protein
MNSQSPFFISLKILSSRSPVINDLRVSPDSAWLATAIPGLKKRVRICPQLAVGSNGDYPEAVREENVALIDLKAGNRRSARAWCDADSGDHDESYDL